MAQKESSSVLRQIPSGVWVLGFVSMLMDISSEMVHSLLPMFMVTVLGTSAFTVGIIEGLAESTALIEHRRSLLSVLPSVLAVIGQTAGLKPPRMLVTFADVARNQCEGKYGTR